VRQTAESPHHLASSKGVSASHAARWLLADHADAEHIAELDLPYGAP
jgi:hypothetical protein